MPVSRIALVLSLVPGLLLESLAKAQVNVLTYHNDNARTGANQNETLLTPSNVRASTFGKLFTYNVDGYVYAQPLYVSGVNIPGQGIHNIVFVATEHNSVYAFDADTNAGQANGLLWKVNLGPSAATPNNDFGTRYGGFQTIVPEVGITGTPVIDLASATLYVDAFTHEGSSYFHRVHALNIFDGTERAFSPAQVSASISGNGVGSSNGVLAFEPKQHLQRSALTLAGGILYAAYAGYDDTDPYHGWVIGFNSTNLQQLPSYVFNTTPNANVASYGTNAGEGGIWMAGCGLSADGAGSLYFAVGNGSFNALNNAGGTEYADSFIRLSTSGGLSVADYFTPYNQQYLADNNVDVGSGGLLLLPDQPGGVPHLMLGGGKQGIMYLMNRDMMTSGNNHYNSEGSSDAVLQTFPLGGAVMHTPAYFNGKVYTCASGDVLAGFSLVNGMVAVSGYQAGPRIYPYPGATPSVSANGTSNGIVWAVQRSNPAVLVAHNAANLTNEIYTSSQAAGGRDQLTNGVKFAVPTIANGKVYVGSQYALAVFGLLSSPYVAWKSAHFGANANDPAIAGNTVDVDADGLINILEYALASDPNTYSPGSWPKGAIDSNQFQLHFNRNAFATDLTYFIQTTSAFDAPWSNLLTYTAGTGWVTNNPGADVSEAAIAGSAPDEPISVTVSANLSSAPSGATAYFRVIVQQ